MTKHAYSPDTGELIRTETPADWMGTTDIAPPAFDSATAGCFWRGTAWEVVQAVITPVAHPRIAVIDAEILVLEARSIRPIRDAMAALATQQPVDPADAAKITEYATAIQTLRAERKGIAG